MVKEIRQGILFTAVTMALLGGAYHGLLWGIGQAVFPDQAEGSLVRRGDGSIAGSRLIAQKFERPGYCHPRPSAVDYNAASAAGSNYGVSNPDHLKTVKERIDAVTAADGVTAAQIPSEMVTASGGGLDPHIPPEAAALQAPRVARARAIDASAVGELITGDNPLTAAAIAAEAGVDDFMAEATPEQKLKLIRSEQGDGRMVAMTGDGTNDAPALAQADVGVAMNTGTMAAKEAGNMVDLDSNPTKLIEIVEIGKQLLMTRGALTTFSIANDVAKYFAIIPAMFILAFPQLGVLNIMGLANPQSAILSAVVFNAVIIIALIPLALRGIPYKPLGAAAILRRNLLVYGVGGVLLPFLGIKAIDVLLVALGLA